MRVPGGLVGEIHDLVERITPYDGIERRHRERCLAWLRGTEDVFRRAKPRTPSTHLVSYFLVRDRADGAALLVDHVNAGLWLPSGGHVEPGEHPAATVRREVREELGVPAAFAPEAGERPLFVTLNRTAGAPAERHTDVSLWFVLDGHRDQVFTPDPGEFRAIRWWTPEEIAAADKGRFDPHLGRMLAKLAAL